MKNVTRLGLLVALVGLSGLQARAEALREVLTGEMTVSASSERSRAEGAPNAVSGLAYRPWISAAGRGTSEWLDVQFHSTRYITKLRFAPGHQGSTRSFKKYARPAKVKVTWSGGEHVFDIQDRRSSQELRMPRLARSSRFRLKIQAIHGSPKEGVAIGTIVFLEPRDIVKVDPKLRAAIEKDIKALSDPATREDAQARLVAHGRPAVPWLLGAVRRNDESALAALLSLVAIGGPDATRILNELLTSGDPVRTRMAVLALTKHPVEGLEKVLLGVAKKETGAASALAVAYLLGRTHAEALSMVDGALKEYIPEVVEAVQKHLANYEAKGYAVAKALASSERVNARIAGAGALGHFPIEAAQSMPLFEKLVRDPDEDVQLASIASLLLLKTPSSRKLLRLALGDARRSVQETIIRSLVKGRRDELKTLQVLLHHGHPNLARRILRGLARQKRPAVRELLINEVLTADRRLWYSQVLDQFKHYGTEGISALLERIQEKPKHAGKARDFLTLVATKAAPLAAEKLTTLDVDLELEPVQHVLLHTLKEAADAKHAPVVIQLFQKGSTPLRMRKVALETLGYLQSQKVRDFVLSEIEKQEADISGVAIRAAARLGDRRAIPKMLAILEGRHARTWNPLTIEGLGIFGAKEAVPMWQRNWGMTSLKAKIAILHACKRIRSREAIRILMDASVTADGIIRRTALSLLQESD